MTKYETEDRDAILQQCEAEGLDMTQCRAMSFRDLRDMWADYQSDAAMMAGVQPGV
jgi:hypothetical protein